MWVVVGTGGRFEFSTSRIHASWLTERHTGDQTRHDQVTDGHNKASVDESASENGCAVFGFRSDRIER